MSYWANFLELLRNLEFIEQIVRTKGFILNYCQKSQFSQHNIAGLILTIEFAVTNWIENIPQLEFLLNWTEQPSVHWVLAETLSFKAWVLKNAWVFIPWVCWKRALSLYLTGFMQCISARSAENFCKLFIQKWHHIWLTPPLPPIINRHNLANPPPPPDHQPS